MKWYQTGDLLEGTYNGNFQDEPGKKKKKKKKQRDGDIKPAIVVPRMRIVDTDVDVSLLVYYVVNQYEEEISSQ